MCTCSFVHTVELEDFVWFIVHLGAPVGDAAIAVGRGEELAAPNPRHASQNLGETWTRCMDKHTFGGHEHERAVRYFAGVFARM